MGHMLLAGMNVYTMDNEKLGEVTEIRGRYFRVGARDRPTYWLSRDAIADYGVAMVRLAFRKDDLDDQSVDESEVVF